MKNSLTISEIKSYLPNAKAEYKTMLSNIEETLPQILKSSSNFYKSHSQFMGVTLDVTAITPIRSIKHTLAELDLVRLALQHNFISVSYTHLTLPTKRIV